jgi:hypothetical protein
MWTNFKYCLLNISMLLDQLLYFTLQMIVSLSGLAASA